VNTVWTYIVEYNYVDAAWNVSSTITRTVVIEDTTAPAITLNWSWSVTLEAWSTYSEQWGTVNTLVPWTYEVEYDYTDGNGNVATTVIRTVIVEDTTAPVITLNGSWSITLEVWTTYSELWAEFSDIVDWTWSAVISWSVDVNTVWTYVVEYSYTDSSGNTHTEIRTVVIEDTTVPVITLNWSWSVTLEAWDSYNELWAERSDTVDGTWSASVSGTVNMLAPWTYTVEYNYTDSNGNDAGTVTRTIVVEDTTAADLTLNGTPTVTLEIWSTYSELWAEFSDIVDGTWSAIISWTVDVNTVWTYIVEYDYTDTAWNVSSTITRTVIIEDGQ